MPKFFADPIDIADQVTLHSGNMHHIMKVLRGQLGDELMVCDGSGTDYRVRIATILPDRILCDIVERIYNDREPKVKITLFQGVPKGDKLSFITEKAVEAGVFQICPVMMKRCVVKAKREDFEKKAIRLRSVSEAAAKQCGRGIVPEVKHLMTLEEVISQKERFDLMIFPYELEEECSLKERLRDFSGKTIGVIIGSEGGFDPQEVTQLQEAGILPVSLGKRILRTETAGLATIFNILYELE